MWGCQDYNLQTLAVPIGVASRRVFEHGIETTSPRYGESSGRSGAASKAHCTPAANGGMGDGSSVYHRCRRARSGTSERSGAYAFWNEVFISHGDRARAAEG